MFTRTIKLNLLLIFVVIFLSLRATYYSVEVLSRVTLVKNGAHYCYCAHFLCMPR